MNRGVVDREALIGVVIAGGFGAGWALWAASGLSAGAATTVRVAGIVIGAAVVTGGLVRRRAAGRHESSAVPESGSMFRSRGYLIWVLAELAAIIAGNALLGATGHGAYVAAWTAAVVGVHFLGFGRLFAALFYWVGSAFAAAAIAGALAGAISGHGQAVEVTTGLIAAVSLFAAGAWGLLAPAPAEPSGPR